jgi:hypothetical protein
VLFYKPVLFRLDPNHFDELGSGSVAGDYSWDTCFKSLCRPGSNELADPVTHVARSHCVFGQGSGEALLLPKKSATSSHNQVNSSVLSRFGSHGRLSVRCPLDFSDPAPSVAPGPGWQFQPQFLCYPGGNSDSSRLLARVVRIAHPYGLLSRTLRPVTGFMNKFRRKLCLVDYGGNSGLTGHCRLLGVVLHD